AFCGITMVHGIFFIAAAYATPWAWLPAEAAITPWLACLSVNLLTFTNAPRTLNEPVTCWHSSFRNRFVQASLEKVLEFWRGVFLTVPAISSRALSISSTVGARCFLS